MSEKKKRGYVMDDVFSLERERRIINGEDVVPYNREEMFIKRLFDINQPIPMPITNKEVLLKMAIDKIDEERKELDRYRSQKG